ncbi:MAG: Recombination protein MgsA [Herminiimonas sp.]|nr:Recombination protein MgsA [Herminiimonas sp.]
MAAKSNAGHNAYNYATAFVKKDKRWEVPVHLRNAIMELMKELGNGHEYRYAHDEPNAYASGETYRPDDMKEPGQYQPVPRGLEIQIAEKLASLKKWDKEAEKNKRNIKREG